MLFELAARGVKWRFLRLGALIGTVATTPISGFIAAAYGWPSIFYAFGTVGLVVGLTAVFFGADTPAKHRLISELEKNYIQSSLGGAKVQVSYL